MVIEEGTEPGEKEQERKREREGKKLHEISPVHFSNISILKY